MTCVWDGIIRKLKLNMTPSQLVTYLKRNNRVTPKILCNGTQLTKQQQKENYTRIKNINSITQGYDCSSCDPLLYLISKLYRITIIHEFCGTTITYKRDHRYNRPRIKFYSNSSHFW